MTESSGGFQPSQEQMSNTPTGESKRSLQLRRNLLITTTASFVTAGSFEVAGNPIIGGVLFGAAAINGIAAGLTHILSRRK